MPKNIDEINEYMRHLFIYFIYFSFFLLSLSVKNGSFVPLLKPNYSPLRPLLAFEGIVALIIAAPIHQHVSLRQYRICRSTGCLEYHSCSFCCFFFFFNPFCVLARVCEGLFNALLSLSELFFCPVY